MPENEFDREHLAQELADACAENRRLESRVRDTEVALREAEQRLQQAQKMETLGTLVAGVAHEINNPINLILYNLPLLQKIWADLLPALIGFAESAPESKFGGFTSDFLKDNLAQLIADMEMAANRVTKIVADLKNFSRQSNIAEKHLLNINTAVKNALRLAQSNPAQGRHRRPARAGAGPARGRGQPAEHRTGRPEHRDQRRPGHRSRPRGDPDPDRPQPEGRAGAAAGYGNGRGVSRHGRPDFPALSSRTSRRRGERDSGFRSATASSRRTAGIFFENREGGAGTAFTVQLPTPLKRRAAKILLVDDDPMVRQILMQALTIPRCYLLEEATNGIEASIRLGTYRPDLLILDVFMPEMDGVEVCRSIKAEPALAGMKVIITTGFPGHPKLDELAALGFTTVLTKPFKIPELFRNVEALLAER